MSSNGKQKNKAVSWRIWSTRTDYCTQSRNRHGHGPCTATGAGNSLRPKSDALPEKGKELFLGRGDEKDMQNENPNHSLSEQNTFSERTNDRLLKNDVADLCTRDISSPSSTGSRPTSATSCIVERISERDIKRPWSPTPWGTHANEELVIRGHRQVCKEASWPRETLIVEGKVLQHDTCLPVSCKRRESTQATPTRVINATDGHRHSKSYENIRLRDGQSTLKNTNGQSTLKNTKCSAAARPNPFSLPAKEPDSFRFKSENSFLEANNDVSICDSNDMNDEKTSQSQLHPSIPTMKSITSGSGIDTDLLRLSLGSSSDEAEDKTIDSARMLELLPGVSVETDRFGQVDRLGCGMFGAVYKVTYKNQPTAAKIGSHRKQDQESLALKAFNSPFVIRFLDCYHQATARVILMERAATCLAQLLGATWPGRRSGMPVYIGRYICACLVEALSHVHTRGWIHLDIKPENILFCSSGTPKLCDFSSARLNVPGKKHDGKGAYPVGTEGYIAPEIVQQQGYDYMADWFSLGVLLYHLLVGKLPWMNNDIDMLHKLTDANQMSYDKLKFNPHAKTLIEALFSLAPDRRLGSDNHRQITDHPFFSGINWYSLQRGHMKPPRLLVEKLGTACEG